jgi:hypothetical protein
VVRLAPTKGDVTRKTMSSSSIASLVLDAQRPDEERFAITIEIGTPYHRETGEWACPVSLHGLYERLRDASGNDSFQALCMAISLAQDLLQTFQDKGGTLLLEGDRFQLEPYAFGPAARRKG